MNHRRTYSRAVWACGCDQSFDWPKDWGCEKHVGLLPFQRVLSAALGGAVARYAPDGERPAQALSLEETTRRAPARDNADGHEDREPYRGYDIQPARSYGYSGQGPLHAGPIVACSRASKFGMSCGCAVCLGRPGSRRA